MQVVVAGATGFVGSEVVRQALRADHSVFALVRAEKDARFGEDPEYLGRLTVLPWGADPQILREAFDLQPGCWIVNAAGLPKERPGLDPHQVHQTIVQTLIEMAEVVQAMRLVHLNPLLSATGDAFIHSKANAERKVQGSGTPWSVLRSAPAYGPGDDLLDGIGAWMARSPVIPRFLESVPLQPIWVGDLAEALLKARPGVQEVGGERILWGELLERCAEAAGKKLLGPALADDTVRRLARAFGHRPLFMDLVPFTEAGFLRHRNGYVVEENAFQELVGHPPRSLEEYLHTEWPYRLKTAPPPDLPPPAPLSGPPAIALGDGLDAEADAAPEEDAPEEQQPVASGAGKGRKKRA